MRVISIAASGNGSGKTLTLAAILKAHPGRLDAVKFTTVFKDGVHCPRTEKACACRSLHGRFTVVTDPAVLATEETDTGRLTLAGARSVLWCLAQPGAHSEAWDHLRRHLLDPGGDAITEGNSAVRILAPDLLVTVLSPSLDRERWKPDAWELARRSDLVIINSYGASEGQIEALGREVGREAPGVRATVEDVSLPLDAWNDGRLRARVSELLAAPGSGGA